MKFAFIQGHFSSSTRGPYRVHDLASHDFSGSESFYFNMVREIAAAGHEVDAYGFWVKEHKQGSIHYVPFQVDGDTSNLHLVRKEDEYNGAVVWNEPDYLTVFPKSVYRICVQQLNDFGYCKTDYKQSTDLFLLPSERHREHIIARDGLPPEKCRVLSNCVSNEDNFSGPEDHANKKIVYCSSPDRGLHWLAEFFPEVRKRVPEAELHIYYRVDSWLNRFNSCWSSNHFEQQMGFRARYITEFLRRHSSGKESGVYAHGGVSNKEMAKALQTSRVLAYPCDPVIFTEGFGVSVLDACTAGALPIISDVDAFGSVYGGVAHIIPGRPGDNREAWVNTIVRALEDDVFHQEVTSRCKNFSKKFLRASRAAVLLSHLMFRY
jgi:glycosyltransferase involved in cell wall biosynthesis